SFVPFYPFASGLLAGKYTSKTTFPEGDYRLRKKQFQNDAFHKHLENVEKIREIAVAKDAEVAHVVLAWYLGQEAIDVVIPGAKRGEQVINNLGALKVDLTEEEMNEMDAIFAK